MEHNKTRGEKYCEKNTLPYLTHDAGKRFLNTAKGKLHSTYL
jgi:hypothetical protein